MNRSPIEWCDYSNNPVSGCNRLCTDETGKIYCYAYYMAQRQKGRNGYPLDEPFRPTLHFDKLIGPDRVKKPARFYQLLRSWTPAPRIDLFARHVHEGFDGWGNEYVGDGILAPFLEESNPEVIPKETP